MSRKPIAAAEGEEPKRPLCFVVGPIGQRGSEIYDNAVWLLKGLIEPVASSEEFGYRVKRADQDPNPGSVKDALILDILNAELVVADLTGANANAFYEVGLRHMVAKPIIHITSDGETLPFDNNDQRTIFVNRRNFEDFERAKAELASAIGAVRSTDFVVSNPVTRARLTGKLSESADSRDRLLSNLDRRISAMENLEQARQPRVPPPPPNYIQAIAPSPLTSVTSFAQDVRHPMRLNDVERAQARILSTGETVPEDARAKFKIAAESAIGSATMVGEVRALIAKYGYA